jgi:hypothetical protein
MPEGKSFNLAARHEDCSKGAAPKPPLYPMKFRQAADQLPAEVETFRRKDDFDARAFTRGHSKPAEAGRCEKRRNQEPRASDGQRRIHRAALPSTIIKPHRNVNEMAWWANLQIAAIPVAMGL